ncbi:MAG: TetR/AcrR family transcriptional regulator [Candidatus Borkfalkiaceae bacterium]|nr:TetR/AcrR family transcriptional regulator [Christensenellaceae bacterium]
MKNIVREPRQERAIEKKNKIIKAGYELFSEVGYYGTNTAEIAKRAGVSTGIVYGYFQDKRDILLSVLEIYLEKVSAPLLKRLDGITAPINYSVLAPLILSDVIKTHKANRKMHEALHSLSGSDETVNARFITLEDTITAKIVDKFRNLGVTTENLVEKVHFAMDIVQTFSHEYVFDKHDYIDYASMQKIVTETLTSLFEN